MTARRRRRTAGMGRGLVRNWRRGASVRCAEARQQAGRLRGKCFFPPHSVSSIFVHELYLLFCQRPHAQLFANIIQYTSFRWALFAPFFHVRACVRATCACCARAATSEREHTTASHAQCARAMDSHSCVHATCACHACARACMCAGVVHRRVFAHATQKTTKKGAAAADEGALQEQEGSGAVARRWTRCHREPLQAQRQWRRRRTAGMSLRRRCR